MVNKNVAGAVVIGMLIGALLFALTEELLNRFRKDDVADDLETLENGVGELDSLVAELHSTLSKSHQENTLVYSRIGDWVDYEGQIMNRITGLPLLERKKEPTREELHCYTILTSQDRDTPSLDALILEWEDKLNTLGDDAQLSNIDLQNAIQKQQQIIQLLSGISKLLHDTATSIVRKIG